MSEEAPVLHLGDLAVGARWLARGDGFHAHEAWEDRWRPLPRGAERRALQGLIHLAVAVEHRRRGNLRSAAGQWAKARLKLAGGVPWAGFPLVRLVEAVAPCLDAAERGEAVGLPDLGWLATGGALP